ncbi:MAG: DNA polymerase [Pusillimonas sp.]|nr:DNA polymerase [Pusillimonas sp.]MBC43544.1 DNA polymerase [Pusillimonas sp.]|tara:strand:- start:3743 stop:5074 length:1332 start_codon:yes stop_codon:yes gene_type:complete
MSCWISLYIPPDTSHSHAALNWLVQEMQSYTPHIARPVSHTLVLNVQASLSLFNGAHALARKLRQHCHAASVRPVLAMAPTATGAQWLAWQSTTSRRRVLRQSQLNRQLDLLPVAVIPQARPYLDWLHGIACHSIGQLRLLPRAGLQQRTTPALIQAVDAAYARAAEHFTWVQPPSTWQCHHELSYHVQQAPQLLPPLATLLSKACQWLAQHRCACSVLHLLLHHEKGRKARPPGFLKVCITQPGWHTDHFQAVLQQLLLNMQLPAPVIALTLHIPSTCPLPNSNTSLFPDPEQWQQNEAHLFDLLHARLGPKAVSTPAIQALHCPEKTNQWQHASIHALTVRQRPASPCAPADGWPVRPFWLLPKPIALTTRNHQPVYQNEALTLLQGPERIDCSEWLEPYLARDYFIATNTRHIHYWIFREQSSIKTAQQASYWFLHGFFA